MIRKTINKFKQYTKQICFYFCLSILVISIGITEWKLAGSYISNAEIEEIYDNLTKYTGYTKYSRPKLVIIQDDTVINAWTDNEQIAIYSGIINFAQSKDEIAAILGHELAHVLLQHSHLNPNNDPNIQTVLEGNADKLGIYLVLRAGYDVCKAKDLWYRLRDIGGDYELNVDHPNYSYRYWQLDFPQCN